MTVREKLKNGFTILDGGMGTELQKAGLPAGELPERWCLSHPQVVTGIHAAYLTAGSDIISANTFGANALKFGDALERHIAAAMDCAKAAIETASAGRERFIALDIGPLGKMLRPLGDLEFERAVELFSETVRLGVKQGADLILIETMNDAYETKAAVLAAKESCDLPVLVTNVYDAGGKLMTGADPAAMVALLEGLRVDALGLNCSLGPRQMRPIAEQLVRYSSLPVIVKPNAGLPAVRNGQTVYDVSAEDFARDMADIAKSGALILGGCCGTTPDYIARLREAVEPVSPKPVLPKENTVISSYTHAVFFEQEPVLIGERINPTGKKRFKQALLEQDMSYLLNEGLRQAEAGVQALDVNVGLPEIDEAAFMERTVMELQAVTDLPLQIDTALPEALGRALRVYNGKPLINSVNGKRESMAAVFPLAAKYGGVIIALTLDENGIPDRAEQRVEIAERMIREAEAYGIPAKDIIVDPLAMAVSADSAAGNETLRALSFLRERGIKTSLGVSNISFGLPNRDFITSTFFAMALQSGLSAAIMNPYSFDMMKTYHSYRALKGLDSSCADYIAFAGRYAAPPVQTAADVRGGAEEKPSDSLFGAIVRGLREEAARLTAVALERQEPLQVIDEAIVPALDEVGRGFEAKKVYLPQLLMSAEAATAAFEVVKSKIPKTGAETGEKIVLATVQGDIHDIGKNIVKVLLENYGFSVIDLGRDVPPERIVETALREKAPMVGLSALMTTTVPAMAETIRLLKERKVGCYTVVGGAVLTPAYAAEIGADCYAKNAMETVRCAERVLRGKQS